MTSQLLAYTVFDDFAHSFDDWLSQTPYWVVAAVIGVLAVLFIFGLVKRFIVLAVLAALAALVLIGFWLYATSYV